MPGTEVSTAATVAYTFTRTVTITLAADGTFTVTTGVLRPSDLGKKVSIANGTNSCGFQGGSNPGTFLGFLTTYSTTTTGTVSGQQQLAADDCRMTPRAVAGLTMTIGENEPDANYMLMLGCNADERFSWSSKATTGFTLTSSNASSTATCDVLVVR